VSTKPAAPKAVAKVLKLPAATAVSTMSFACAERAKPKAKNVAMRVFFTASSIQNKVKHQTCDAFLFCTANKKTQ
jgi:hypothetical protein